MTVTRDVAATRQRVWDVLGPTDGPTQDGSSGTAESALSVPTGLRLVRASSTPSGPGQR